MQKGNDILVDYKNSWLFHFNCKKKKKPNNSAKNRIMRYKEK